MTQAGVRRRGPTSGSIRHIHRWEASGTSGMKAALNGVPSLSVLDGWWLEGHVEGVTGWAIGASRMRPLPQRVDAAADAGALYDTLERTVLPFLLQSSRRIRRCHALCDRVERLVLHRAAHAAGIHDQGAYFEQHILLAPPTGVLRPSRIAP